MDNSIKIIIDRRNSLVSDLNEITHFKMSKNIDFAKVNLIRERIKELDWVLDKIGSEIDKKVESVSNQENTVTITSDIPFVYTYTKKEDNR